MDSREELLVAIDAAWEKHSQVITVQIPAGAECHISRHGQVMAQLGFRLAVVDIIDKLMGRTK